MRFACCGVVQRALSRCFSSHIRAVLRYPVPFVLLPLLSSALLSLGLLRLCNALVKDALELYTPTDARARAELRALGTLFPINDTDPFYASRRYDLRRMGFIIVTGVDRGDILKPTTLKAAANLWSSIIQSITIDQQQDEQRDDRRRSTNRRRPPIDYPSLCVRFPLSDSLDEAISALFDDHGHHQRQQRHPNRTASSSSSPSAIVVEDPLCVSNPLLELVKLLSLLNDDDSSLIKEQQQKLLMGAAMLTKTTAIAAANGRRHGNGSFPDGGGPSSSLAQLLLRVLSLEAVGSGVRGLLGGLTFHPETHTIAGAKALMLPYALRHGTDAEDALAEQWELKLAQFLDHFYSPHIQANWWTYETLAAESARDQQRLQHWLLPCFVAVSVFTVLLCCCSSPVLSRPLLALSGVLSVALAISSGTGLLLLLGFPLTSIVLAMPFIIFSVGVDNVFILLAAWRSTSPSLSLEQRMAHTFGDAGVSITITFLTDFLSFSVGCLTPFPSVQMFCLFCAVTLLFSYAHQMTLFAALMCLTCRREVQQRHCLTMRKVPKQSGGTNSSCCASAYAAQTAQAYGSVVVPPPPLLCSHNLALSRFFRSHYTPFLLNKFVQSLVLLLFCFYLLVSAYGCLNIEIGLEPLDLLPDNSNGKRALLEAEQYFPDHGGNLHVWMHNLSHVNLGHRRLWLVLEKEIELYEHTEFTGAADSWLRSFLQFYNTKGQLTSTENFVPRLKHFLGMKAHRKFRRDVRFTNDGRMLESSRVAVRLRFVGFQNQSRAMHLFRLLAESSELPTGVYADFFLFAEQFDALLPGTVTSIAVAGLAVVMVSLLLIPEPISALWVSFSTVSINLGILGLMPFLSIRLDFVSMVTIIMSIGFCADFSAHLAFNYSRVDDPDNDLPPSPPSSAAGGPRNAAVEKMGNALYAVGTPICQCAATSILGVSFLAHTESYIFRSFFKTTVLVISLGVLHGLVILPVLLTLAHQQQRNGCAGGGTAEDDDDVPPKGRQNKWTQKMGHDHRQSNGTKQHCGGIISSNNGNRQATTATTTITTAVEISAPMCRPPLGFILPAYIFDDQRNHLGMALARTRTADINSSCSWGTTASSSASLYSLNSTLPMRGEGKGESRNDNNKVKGKSCQFIIN